jgi:hypothetical protein
VSQRAHAVLVRRRKKRTSPHVVMSLGPEKVVNQNESKRKIFL